MFPRHEYLQQQQQMPQQLSTRSSQQYQQPAQQTQFLQTQTSYPQSQKPIGLRLDMQQVMSGASRPSSAGSYSAPISSTPATTPSYVSESVSNLLYYYTILSFTMNIFKIFFSSVYLF